MSSPIAKDDIVAPRARWIEQGQAAIRHEADVMLRVAQSLDDRFASAVEMILNCRGDVIVSGIGKAGHVGTKLAATFASTGTRSHFLHPAEAIHGDLGRVGEQDIVLMLSQSGETEEIVRLLPIIRGLGATLIAMTSSAENTLGKAAEVVLELGGIIEACPLNLAPTASTAAMLALGDALAITASEHRGFRPEDFARYHPGGSLGRKLAFVEEKMRPLAQCRVASDQLSIREVFQKVRVNGRRTGAVMLVDAEGRLSGIFTDSDLARLFERDDLVDINASIATVMTRRPKTTTAGTRFQAALHRLANEKISELPVIDAQGRPLGMLDVTDMVGQVPCQTEEPAVRPTLKIRYPNQDEREAQMNLEQRCQGVELLLTDVDGVLTDGGVIINNEGVESKQFHIRDGLGFKLWRQAGFKCGVITGRNSQVVRLRAQELNLDIVRQGITDKAAVAQEVLKKFNLEPHQLAFVGDDLIDLGAIRLAGLGIAVADAVEEVKQAADYVTKTPGGKGAIREVIEMILKAKKVWNDIIHTY